MTLSRFIKALQKLESQGWGRASVAADKPSFFDGNGTFSICDVQAVEGQVVTIADGDGCAELNSDGSERTRRTVVIGGRHYETINDLKRKRQHEPAAVPE